MSPYLVALIVVSFAVATAERLRPRRAAQRLLRPGLASDLCYLAFNAHVLGLITYAVGRRFLLPVLDGALAARGATGWLYRGLAAGWPAWAQWVVLLLLADLLQYFVHRLLHAVPWLWRVHRVHHSVVDGEMDWIVSFRFHWAEGALYQLVQYPLYAFFGFAPGAVLAYAVVGTLVGHLNHANLDLGHGAWRYVLNSPRMHLWHHDADARPHNFAVIFSAWDWLFGTARLPEGAPRRIGLPEGERCARGFLAQQLGLPSLGSGRR